LILLAAPACMAQLRFGTGAVKITPPAGAPMAGYYFSRAAEGVHDDLWAKAVVFERDGNKAAMVACDLIDVPRAVVEQARAEVAKATGIAANHVMISATHAHTGPVVLSGPESGALRGSMLEIARAYAAELPAKIAQSVALANQSLQEAKVSAGVGREDSLAFNRRFFMKDGTVGWNPGKLNPNIVKPAGPIDPDVAVAYFESASATPLATYVNYPMHLDTVGGLRISADYPYTLADLLAKTKGPGMLTMFTIGCAGNINHLDVRSGEEQKGSGEAARIGTVLAGEVLKTYTRLRPIQPRSLATRSEIVKLPLAAIQAGDVEKAREIASRFDQPNAAPFLEQVNAFKILDVAARHGKPIEAEVQVIALGNDLAWVGLPGEIFVELGMDIKQRSPFRYTIVAELANGSIDYVPNRKAYAEGNYEVVSARVGEGAGELLADTAVRLLKDIHAGSAPQESSSR
jgi:neutral ceramidase